MTKLNKLKRLTLPPSSFLRGSLFEKDFGDESGDAVPSERRRSYDIDWDRHIEDVTEEYLLERTPALAIDFLYHLVSSRT